GRPGRAHRAAGERPRRVRGQRGSRGAARGRADADHPGDGAAGQGDRGRGTGRAATVPAGRRRLPRLAGRIGVPGRELLAAHHLRQRAGLHQARRKPPGAVHHAGAGGGEGDGRGAVRRAAGAARRDRGQAPWRLRQRRARHGAGELPRRPRHHRRQLRFAGDGRARRARRPGLRHELGSGGLELGVRPRHDPHDRGRHPLRAVDHQRSAAGAAPGGRTRRRAEGLTTMRTTTLAAALAATLIAAAAPAAHADEGMWKPSQMPQLAAQLKARGLQMDPAALSNLAGKPLDAVISLGGCTASFVSPQGLVVTNHHCGYGAIQYNSTPERDLLATGFVAGSLAEELPADPNARIYVTQAITDVTGQVTEGLDALDGKARFDAIEAREKALVAGCEAPGGLRCNVYSFNGGLEYSLIRQLEIQDVRLVYAPPEAIGKYGGDEDNFEWPRHTGDWSFLRAYVGPDGKPAPYSKDNVPFRPASWLTVSQEPLEAGDYVMVTGYP